MFKKLLGGAEALSSGLQLAVGTMALVGESKALKGFGQLYPSDGPYFQGLYQTALMITTIDANTVTAAIPDAQIMMGIHTAIDGVMTLVPVRIADYVDPVTKRAYKAYLTTPKEIRQTKLFGPPIASQRVTLLQNPYEFITRFNKENYMGHLVLADYEAVPNMISPLVFAFVCGFIYQNVARMPDKPFFYKVSSEVNHAANRLGKGLIELQGSKGTAEDILSKSRPREKTVKDDDRLMLDRLITGTIGGRLQLEQRGAHEWKVKDAATLPSAEQVIYSSEHGHIVFETRLNGVYGEPAERVTAMKMADYLHSLSGCIGHLVIDVDRGTVCYRTGLKLVGFHTKGLRYGDFVKDLDPNFLFNAAAENLMTAAVLLPLMEPSSLNQTAHDLPNYEIHHLGQQKPGNDALKSRIEMLGGNHILTILRPVLRAEAEML